MLSRYWGYAQSDSPPSEGEEAPGRCRLYGGSDNWTRKAEDTGEQDRDRCRLLAVSDKPVDFDQIEAECRAAGILFKWTRPHWRGQFGDSMEVEMILEETLEYFADLGYSIAKQARLGLSTDEPADDYESGGIDQGVAW